MLPCIPENTSCTSPVRQECELNNPSSLHRQRCLDRCSTQPGDLLAAAHALKAHWHPHTAQKSCFYKPAALGLGEGLGYVDATLTLHPGGLEDLFWSRADVALAFVDLVAAALSLLAVLYMHISQRNQVLDTGPRADIAWMGAWLLLQLVLCVGWRSWYALWRQPLIMITELPKLLAARKLLASSLLYMMPAQQSPVDAAQHHHNSSMLQQQLLAIMVCFMAVAQPIRFKLRFLVQLLLLTVVLTDSLGGSTVNQSQSTGLLSYGGLSWPLAVSLVLQVLTGYIAPLTILYMTEVALKKRFLRSAYSIKLIPRPSLK